MLIAEAGPGFRSPDHPISSLAHYPQNVILHFYASPGKLRLDSLLEFLHGRCAVLAVEATGIVHQDHVARYLVPQNGFQFCGESLFVALQAGPAVVAGVEPEECGLAKRLEQFRDLYLTVAFLDVYMRPALEFRCRATRQLRVIFHGG